ncbi:MAG: ADOP family duplicated permease [Xanthomonadaceae bacterium]|jgi:predicted permease|nr:ADOP family duplicated permease [Xanthomonadaceae bacterium]
MGFTADLLHALRQLGRRPLLMLLAVLPLGLSIAALSALYAIVEASLLGPMPGIDDTRGTLVEIGRGDGLDTVSWPGFKSAQREVQSFDDLYAWSLLPVNLRADSAPGSRRALGMMVSGGYFATLGVRAAHGRLLDASDEDAGPRAPRVVLGHAAFERLLGGDPARVGSSVFINGHAYVVVGVAEPRFRGHIVLLSPDVFLPLTVQPLAQPSNGAGLLQDAGASWMTMGGRLREGVDLATGAAELAAISPRVEGLRRDDGVQETLKLAPLRALPRELATPLVGMSGVLGALVLVVLLVACTNVAGWLLARGEARLAELGVRMALGASRLRILRLLLAEAVLVALLALALALAGVHGLLGLLPRIALPAPFPIVLQVPLTAGVLLFALAATAFTVLAAGLLPALRVSGAVRGFGAGARSTRRTRLRDGMVAGQVALTAFLLVGAGLFANALHKSQRVDIGFDPRGLFNADLDLEPSGYDEARQQDVLAAVLERVRALPGVEQAALARVVPLTLNQMSLGVVVDDDPSRELFSPSANLVSPAYFATLGVSLAGREFTPADRAGAQDVVVINRRLAQHLFGTTDAVDRSFRYGGRENPRTLRVVGVADDGRYASWHENPEPFMWLPLAQWPSAQLNLVVRSALPHAQAARDIAGAVSAVDPDLPLPQVHDMRDSVALSILPQRIATLGAGVAGALGLLLAALGLYGLLAQYVAARTREIGVRLSLGATPTRVARDVAWRGARLVLAGLLLGLAGASGLAVAAQSLLFGVAAGDLLPFAVAALAVLCCAVLACLGPARRAAATTPAAALRAD